MVGTDASQRSLDSCFELVSFHSQEYTQLVRHATGAVFMYTCIYTYLRQRKRKYILLQTLIKNKKPSGGVLLQLCVFLSITRAAHGNYHILTISNTTRALSTLLVDLCLN